MHQDKENKLKEMLIEQAIIHMRECYSHAFNLTKTVVTLNTFTLGVGGIFLKFGKAPSLIINELTIYIFVFSGLLIALFGVVFNLGASAVHSNLYSKGVNLARFIKTEMDGEAFQAFFISVVDTSKGGSYLLTKIFFIICSLIWLSVGSILILLGTGRI